jgi:PAS domain S-box-containing protein
MARPEPPASPRPHRSEPALTRADEVEAMYRTLVAQLPVITYTEALDDGRTLSISPQVEAVLGYTQEEWMNNALLWKELLHPEDRDRVIRSCDLANQTREAFRAEYRMLSRDGRLLWIRDEAVLVRASGGEPLCWQGVMMDVTSEKQADETQARERSSEPHAGGKDRSGDRPRF